MCYPHGFDLKRIYLDVNCSYNNKKDYYDNIKDILKEAIQIAPEIEIVWVLSSFINEFELIKANEIINDLPLIDGYFSTYGTSGTLIGTAKRLKEYNQNIQITHYFSEKDMNRQKRTYLLRK